MDSGWIKLYRKIRENSLWQEQRKFSKFEAWLDLLLSANHAPAKVIIGIKIVIVNRGQFLTSKSALAKRWGWNWKTVDGTLEVFKQAEMLDSHSSNETESGYTLITIRNYSKYQDKESGPLDSRGDSEAESRGRADRRRNWRQTRRKK